MKDSQKSAFERTVGRALLVAAAAASLATLLDAGAKYPGATWRAAPYASEPPALELGASPWGFTRLEFRLSGNLPLERGQKTCAAPPAADSASQGGDEPFDINCAGGPTVKAVGDLPHAELLSWPGDWMYHRALRF